MGYIGPGWDDPQFQERIVREQRAEGERMARFYQREARLKEERENRALRARWDAREAEQRLESARHALALAQERVAAVEGMGLDASAEREYLARVRASYERAEHEAAAARAAASGAPSYP
jgi:hypothetical protein